MFSAPVTHIHWHCGVLQPNLEKRLKSEIGGVGITIHRGIPESPEKFKSGNVIILDDLMTESVSSAAVTHMFTKIVHHHDCFLINIVQNLFSKGSDSKTRALSTHYLVIFKNPRDKTQIAYLARQMQNKYLEDAFIDASNQGPYSYIFLDFHQKTPEAIRARTRILPHETPQYAYMTPEQCSDIIKKQAYKQM